MKFFFETVVFVLVIIPIVNELVFVFRPSLVVRIGMAPSSDEARAISPLFTHITGASFVVAILGLFTSETLLFWGYFLIGFLPMLMEKWKPGLRTKKRFVIIDGVICLAILTVILFNRFIA